MNNKKLCTTNNTTNNNKSQEEVWSSSTNLPEEIWETVKTHITSHIDVFRFRSVCKSWRSLLPLTHLHSTLSPPLLPPSSFLSPVYICRIQNNNPPLTTSFLTRLESSHDAKMELFIPLSSRRNLKNNDGRVINMLEYRVTEIARGCMVKVRYGEMCNVRKVLMVEHGFGVVGIFNRGRLGLWRYGEQEWSFLQHEVTVTVSQIQTNLIGLQKKTFDDAILFKGQVYVVDNLGIVWWVDVSRGTTTSSLVQYSQQIFLGGDKKWLVESEGKIYLVDMFLTKWTATEFRVYFLDEEWGTWVHVSCLGDERFFVLDKDCSFSASIEGLDECLGNCIFFKDSRNSVNRLFRLVDRRIRRAECGHYRSIFSPPVSLRYNL